MKNLNLTTTVVLAFIIIISASCKKSTDVASSKNSIQTSTNNEVVSASSLIAWYQFTNGSLKDQSGNANDIVFSNATITKDYKGRPNNAYYFNGTNAYMSVNHSTTLDNPTQITMGVLIKPMGYYTGTGGSSRIFMKGVDDQQHGDYFLGFNNTGQYYGTYGNGQFNSNGAASTPGTVQLNKWTKLVYTYDGVSGKLYVNDTLVSIVNKTAVFNPNSDPLNIAKTGRIDYPYWFNGVIDEIRIYNTAIPQNLVHQITQQLGAE